MVNLVKLPLPILTQPMDLHPYELLNIKPSLMKKTNTFDELGFKIGLLTYERKERILIKWESKF